MKKRFLTACLAALIAATAVAGNPGSGPTRQLTYAGLPTITYVSDGNGQVTDVAMDGRAIISYDWTSAPYAVPIRFFNRWTVVTSVLPDGSASQQVVDSHGAQRLSGAVLAYARQHARPAVVLDAFAADLGLNAGWQEGMETISANEVRLPANGKISIIRYHATSDGVRVAEADGKPVLWDIDLPLGVSGRLGQLVPSRLIVTSTGAVQIAADIPFVDGIESLWTNDSSGSNASFRTLRANDTVGSASVKPLAMMICDSSYVCTYSDGCPSCGGCSTTYYWCDPGSGGSGGSPPPDDGSGGTGTPPPKTPQEQQRDLYVNQPCSPVPDASQFLDATGYGSSGLQNYFSFADFKSPSANYVLVDGGLVTGLGSMARTVSIPGLSDPGNGAGYRIPGANSATPCGDHTYGTAVDLSVRNSSGTHDCNIWNALAVAGNAAGGWVEPASSIAPNGGVPNHFHIAFDGRTNTNYGDACTN